MISILRLGLVQGDCATLPAHDAREQSARLLESQLARIDEAVRVGVQLLCFGELFSQPYFPAALGRSWLELAESAHDGPLARRLRDLARLHRIVIVAPFCERAAGGRCYSSAMVIESDGSLLGVTRRHHIPPEERATLLAGDSQFPVFETSLGRIGVILGADRHIPEGPRILGLKGAEVLLFPVAAAGDPAGQRMWDVEPLACGAQNLAYVAACNRAGREILPQAKGAQLARSYFGSSYVADWRGRLLARASKERGELLWTDLDLGRLRRLRKTNDPRPLRRPSTYQILTQGAARAQQAAPQDDPIPKKNA